MAASDFDKALALLALLLVGSLPPSDSAIGVNWGTISTHRLSPSIVVDLLKENRIGKVKLFGSEPEVLRALMGSGIEVMVGIPNEMLAALSSSPAAADVWVSQNVSRYVVKGGVNIRLYALTWNYLCSSVVDFRNRYMKKIIFSVVPKTPLGPVSDLVSAPFLSLLKILHKKLSVLFQATVIQESDLGPLQPYRHIAVGNEPFLTSYQGQFQSFVVPAMLNLQQSLAKANLAGYIKLVVPCNADVYEASLPSQGAFRPDLTQIMTQLVSFINSNGSPFIVNIYPFLNLYQNTDFPQDYAFFEGSSHPVVDGQSTYYNAFDGNFDTLVAALNKIGYGQMPIVIGEVGWPTDGAFSGNLSAARAFNQGLVNHVLSSKGTPLRPGVPPADVYLFGLLDEEQKSTLPGNFERHWGIFSFDGQAKYPLNLGNGVLKNARNVQYLPSRWCVANPFSDHDDVSNHMKIACNAADCTTLLYGGLCNAIGDKGNISYAFNSYYQAQKQDERSCDFDGLGMVTFLDPSIGDCHFLVGINDSSSSSITRRTLSILVLWIFVYQRILGSL